MHKGLLFIALTAALGFTTDALAKAPADATGECKDGTYTQADHKEGACSGHGGIKKWLAKATAAERPANATGQCKDGSYTDAASKSGACSGHKGVKAWYGGETKGHAKAESKENSRADAKDHAKAEAKEATRSAPQVTPAQKTKTSERTANEQQWVRPTTAAAGGGAGKVWVNHSSKVYHCEKDEWYGKTKDGEYMSEAQAKASGSRAARGKECR